jgi:hypothetical protein
MYTIYTNRKGVIIIPFDTITHLKFPSVKYTGGWIKIVSPKNSIRLTVVIQDIGDFLQELKNALDRKEFSNCYNRKKMFSFFKTAEFSNQCWSIRLTFSNDDKDETNWPHRFLHHKQILCR